MDAVIFANDTEGYRRIAELIRKICPDVFIRPEISEEAYRVQEKEGCDIEVVALDGARGMEAVVDHCRRYTKSLLIWITDDPYFAGVAIRNRVFDFLIRPLSQTRFEEAVRKAVSHKLSHR